jgi:drug/metabolite transporter (DMT)-like permease
MSRLDLLLLLMVLIWGANFSVVKIALQDFPEVAFNAARLLIASAVFGGAIALSRRRTAGGALATSTLSAADWRRLVLLGALGHTVYQLLFLGGVKRTSVGNASLIVGVSPVLVALFTAMAGHERIPARRWIGAGLAFAGLYLIVGHQVDWSVSGHLGDALMLASAVCWALYSVGSVSLLKRHSPLMVTGASIAIGAVLYFVVTAPVLLQAAWTSISVRSWILMSLSAVLALAVSYLIWYTAVQRLGSTRTSMYSYLTPIAAMLMASLWLGEPVTGRQLAGAAAIFAGLALTRA